MTSELVKADMQEKRFAALPKQVESLKYMIAQLEEEIPEFVATANRKVSKGDKVGASSKRDAAEMLKRKQKSLAQNRAELADSEDMIATGRRPDVPDLEVEFAMEGKREEASKKPAVEPAAEATKAPDPLAVEAERIATERPDMRMVVGLDAEGKPITKSAKEFLDDARGAAKAVEADQDLLRAAASCLLGIA